MLVLCVSIVLAEEMPVEAEAYRQHAFAGQKQSDSGASNEVLVIPPLVADETQGGIPGSGEQLESSSADDAPAFMAASEIPANGKNAQTDAIPLLPAEEEPSPTEENQEKPAGEDPSPTEEDPEKPAEEEPSPTEEDPEKPAGEDPSPAEEDPEQPGEEEPLPTESENEEPASEEPGPINPDLPAGEPPAAEHKESHHLEERVHGPANYQVAENMQMHHAFTTYDLYCIECQRVIIENYRTEQSTEPHTWTYVCEEPTCSQEGVVHFRCALCGLAYDEALPSLEHVWGEWEDHTDYSLPECIREEVKVHRCVNCGQEETIRIPAKGHQWEAVSYLEATCTNDGAALRRCRLCGEEETISLPAFGHSYVQMDSQDSQEKSVCAICGAVKEAPKEQNTKSSQMYYNNTVTSFGPTTRELIGGSVWNRVTPVDLSKEGVFTYPLIASNQYTVGTATLVIGQEGQQVIYRLSSSNINVHSESLVVYPDLEALRTGEHAKSFDFNKPIDLKAYFGEDAHVIIAITLKADYDASSTGVTRFLADQKWIDQMMEMIK